MHFIFRECTRTNAHEKLIVLYMKIKMTKANILIKETHILTTVNICRCGREACKSSFAEKISIRPDSIHQFPRPNSSMPHRMRFSILFQNYQQKQKQKMLLGNCKLGKVKEAPRTLSCSGPFFLIFACGWCCPILLNCN